MRTSVKIAGLMLVYSAFMLAGVSGKTTTVFIRNNLGGGKKMFLHCRSKDDDLGMRELSFGEEFHWSFGLRFLGETLFYCTIWQGNVKGFVFDAFTANRDYFNRASPLYRLLWIVSDECIYGFDSHFTKWDMCIPWPKTN